MTTMSTSMPAATAHIRDIPALRRYARRGDARAFESVASRYQQMVFATCRRVLHNDADAEDAAQETFLKLAKHAGTIRSNVGAWLHAAAVRTSIDIRRKRGVRSTAERAAAKSTGDTAKAQPQRDWAALEPLLDDALSKLTDDDRELIVGHYLAGRSQREIAKSLGISPGNVSRRLTKATERLRGELGAAGLAVSGLALAAALGVGGGVAGGVAGGVGGAVTLPLGKLALAGIAERGIALPLIMTKAGLLSIAALLAFASVVAGAVLIAPGRASTPRPAATAAALPAPERPTQRTRPHTLVASSTPLWTGGVLVVQGERMTFTFPEIDRTVPIAGRYSFNLRIVDQARTREGFTINAVTRDSSPPPGSALPAGPGIPLEIKGRFDSLGRVVLSAQVAEQADRVEWIGTRPAHGAALAQSIPSDAGPVGIQGPWLEVSEWRLTLDADDITMNADRWIVHRFRILDWQDAGDHARIQAIAADSMDPALVGKRSKLLLRREPRGYTLAFREHLSPKLNDWPEGFDVNEGDDLVILTMTEVRP